MENYRNTVVGWAFLYATARALSLVGAVSPYYVVMELVTTFFFWAIIATLAMWLNVGALAVAMAFRDTGRKALTTSDVLKEMRPGIPQ